MVAIRLPKPSVEEQPTLVDALFEQMGVDGVYARPKLYEDVVEGLQRLLTRNRPVDAEVLRFPPVMSRKQLERSGYLNSFPQLLGCVCALHGTEADILSAVDRTRRGSDWTSEATSADLVLTPAACYPLYPIVAQRGPVPEQGLVFDVGADCFRHEPSRDLDRLQSFRMREYVRIGTQQQIVEFRESWISRATFVASRLGLKFTVETASDPFFGRVGQLMAANQKEQELKFELLVPVRPNEAPTACMSFNYHRDYFGKTWGLLAQDGAAMQTGCVAFGIDRLVIALFARHGAKPEAWPAGVREALELGANQA